MNVVKKGSIHLLKALNPIMYSNDVRNFGVKLLIVCQLEICQICVITDIVQFCGPGTIGRFVEIIDENWRKMEIWILIKLLIIFPYKTHFSEVFASARRG